MMTFSRLVFVFYLVSLLVPSFVFAYYNVTIDNASPRRDINGNIMDIHDGNIIYHEGVYYYYGAQYGSCMEPNTSSGCDGGWHLGTSCGFLFNHNVSLYTSRDLQDWTPAPQPVFQMARDFDTPAVLFSPKVIYNFLYKRFTLWFNWDDGTGYYGVAVSASPYGPFKVVNRKVTTLVNAGPSDSALWQDPETHQGYFIYSGAFMVTVEAMTPDFLETYGAKNTSGMVAYDVEAPAFFRRNGVYYVSTGALCCYCKAGSDAKLYSAPHPLGPYNISASLSAAIPSQQTDIFRFIDGQGDEQFMFRGDRWQQSPDGTKGHDPTYFGLIQFDTKGIAAPLVYLNSFQITVANTSTHISISNTLNSLISIE